MFENINHIMSIRIAPLFRIQFFLLLFSSSALGEISSNFSLKGFYNDVVTGNDFILYYEMYPANGNLKLTINDEEFNEQLSGEYFIGKDFIRSNREVVDEKVFLLFTNRNNSKVLSVIDTKTLNVQFFPVSVSLEYIHLFKVIGNTLMVVQSLDQGDFVQLYDYSTGIQISLSEFYFPKTQIWDIKVNDGIFNILMHNKGDYGYQSLKLVGLNDSGIKLYETKVLPSVENNFIFKSAYLFPSRAPGFSIVGTYSKKKSEQFLGYFHIGINEFWEQNTTIHPMRSLEGFFDYKKSPGLRKNSKKLRRDLHVYHLQPNGDFIAIASSSDRVPKKFVHFILFDHTGERIYDTSVKVFYGIGASFYGSTLALVDKNLYFFWTGSPKNNVLPGIKLYEISDGNLTRISKASDISLESKNLSEWEIRYFHWKENKFIVLSREKINGPPKYVIRRIEI
jgi:hypothetical protein